MVSSVRENKTSPRTALSDAPRALPAIERPRVADVFEGAPRSARLSGTRTDPAPIGGSALYATLLEEPATLSEPASTQADGSAWPPPLPANASPVDSAQALEGNLRAITDPRDRDAYLRANAAAIAAAMTAVPGLSEDDANATIGAFAAASELAGDEGRALLGHAVVSAIDTSEEGMSPIGMSDGNLRLLGALDVAMMNGIGTTLAASVAIELYGPTEGAELYSPASDRRNALGDVVANGIVTMMATQRGEYEAAAGDYVRYLSALEEEAAARGFAPEQRAAAYAALEQDPEFVAARARFDEAAGRYATSLEGSQLLRASETVIPRGTHPGAALVEEAELLQTHTQTLAYTDAGMVAVASSLERRGQGQSSWLDQLDSLDDGARMRETVVAQGVTAIGSLAGAADSSRAHTMINGLTKDGALLGVADAEAAALGAELGALVGGGGADGPARVEQLFARVDALLPPGENGASPVVTALKGAATVFAALGGGELPVHTAAGMTAAFDRYRPFVSAGGDVAASVAQMLGRRAVARLLMGPLLAVPELGVASFGAYQNIVNGNFEHAAADTAIATGAGVTALSLLVPISTPVVVAALLVGAAGVLAKALLGEPEDPDVEDARAQFVAAGEQA